MILAVLAAVVGLVTVLVALYRDDTLVAPRPVAAPAWDPLPAPADVARVEFPLSVPGYDPASVDLALDVLAHAYADLLAEAPPDVRARAHRRAALRQGVDPAGAPAHVVDGVAGDALALQALEPDEDPLEALRAAAALATLERRGRDAARHGRRGYAPPADR